MFPTHIWRSWSITSSVAVTRACRHQSSWRPWRESAMGHWSKAFQTRRQRHLCGPPLFEEINNVMHTLSVCLSLYVRVSLSVCLSL